MQYFAQRAPFNGGNTMLLRLIVSGTSPELKRLSRAIVEHGTNAASLFSPQAAAFLDGLTAISSLLTLAVSLCCAVAAVTHYFKTQRK